MEAYLAVVALIESKEASLQRAETDTESQQMQEEIQREAIELIQAHELTLQSYWELLGLANSDPEFRERVLAQVEEASLLGRVFREYEKECEGLGAREQRETWDRT